MSKNTNFSFKDENKAKKNNKISVNEFPEYDVDLKNTGKRLKLIRTIAEMTIAEIANEIKFVTANTISRVEAGKVSPSISLIQFYCKKFKLRFEDILVFKSDDINKIESIYKFYERWEKVKNKM